MMNTTQCIPRIGDILVFHGALTPDQADRVARYQAATSPLPFGELARRLFKVPRHRIDAACRQQALATAGPVDLDLAGMAPAVRNVLTARRAWQFQVLPLHRDDNLLTVATTAPLLGRSVRFLWRTLDEPVRVVVAEPAQLHRYLYAAYPSPLAALVGHRPAAEMHTPRDRPGVGTLTDRAVSQVQREA